MKKNKVKVFVLLFLLGLLVSLGVSYSVNDGGKVSGEFSVQYDASWKVKNGNGLLLEHRKTGSILNIQSKKIDENYIDTELKYLINSIEIFSSNIPISFNSSQSLALTVFNIISSL